jgi:hypothetical protein
MEAFRSAWEASYHNPPLSEQMIMIERDDFEGKAQDMVDRPPGKSVEIEAFAQATVERLNHPDKNKGFIKLVDSLNVSRQEIPAEHRFRLFQIAFQYVLMQENRKGNNQYPTNGHDTAQWHKWIDQIVGNPKLSSDLEDLWPLDNQTNIPQRYAGMRLAITAFSDILPERMSLFDIGTAGFLGPIALEENAISADIDIVTNSSEDQQLVQDAFNHTVNIEQSLGIDQLPPNLRWLDACLYPHEIRDIDLLKKREAMFRRIRERVILGSITDYARLGEARRRLPGGKADVTSASCSNYEIPLEEQETARRNQETHTRFLAAVQDVTKIDPRDPRKLIYARDIYAAGARYTLSVKDMTSPGNLYEELGYWSDFRCDDKFFPAPALIRRLKHVRELGLI